jgi:acyl-CoA synthetase (AMP-forming)/AMP-acid ligase II
MILSQALNNAGLKNPGAPAILDLGKTLSFSDMRKKVGQLSYLHQAEIGHGKRIAFLCQNTQAAIVSFFAFANIGSQCIFFDPNESVDGVVEAMKELEITHVAVSADQIHKVNEISRVHGLNLQIVEIEKKKGGEYDPSYSPPPDHPLKETDQILIVRHQEMGAVTKYIFFTHKQIYTAATAVRKFYHFGANEKVLTTLSFAHPFSLVHGLLTPLFAGACCAVNPQSPSNEEFLEYLATNHVTRFADVPKFYYFLLSICMTAKYKLPGVRSVTVGAGVLPKALRKAFGLLQIPVMQTHGRVEALWTLAMEDAEVAKEGKTPQLEGLPGFKYKVLNDAGDEVAGPAFREGPLAVAGETIMAAFFHPDKGMADKASKTTIRGTWFYTQEAARLEGEEAEIKVKPLGALPEVIKSGAKYFTPEPIDEAARELSDVAEAAAFVRVDEKGAPSFAIAVVRSGKTLSEGAVLQHVSSKIKGAGCPRSVHFVDEIPKDRYDNVNRGALARQFSVR